jgi:hypothetical protein
MNRENFIPESHLFSYAPLLYRAMLDTTGPVIECGMGNYSTRVLHETGHTVLSIETSPEWFSKFDIQNKILIHPAEWVRIIQLSKPFVSVIFIDQAPGEIREKCIADLATGFSGIVVAHDTEPAADYGYKMRQHFPKFKYMVEVKTNGAWATALSNEIDVTKWKGDVFGSFKIE